MRFTSGIAAILVAAVCLAEPGWGQALTVPAKLMVSRCTRQVSPNFPPGLNTGTSTVTLHVLISKMGTVTPLSMVTGNPRLEDYAMSAVRLWHYKPYLHQGQQMAVVTDVDVVFQSGIAGGTITRVSQ